MAFLDETGLAYFWQQIVAKIPVSLKNPYALTVNIDGTEPDFKNGDVFTNDPALLLQYGYKPIIMAEYPSDGGYYTGAWTETESQIKQIWTATEPPEDISADEALEIITGGADI